MMICIYALIAGAVAFAIIPFVYLKIILNAIYIMATNKREKYKGENLL
jgi:hypothetical protein